MEYIDSKYKFTLKSNQLVLCVCPKWNYEGFQVAKWNGKEFEYSNQPNSMFSESVISFYPLTEQKK